MLSTLPFTDQQCFFVAILVFIVVGFQRGWRRELISLVFVLLAVVLVHPNSGNIISQFFERLPGTIGFFLTGSANSPKNPVPAVTVPTLGPWGTLLGFALIVALGYVIGNRTFPKPAAPAERFIGIVPALVSGAFILTYLRGLVGTSLFTVAVQPPDPSNYVPILFVIAIVAVVIGLVASRVKKSAPPAAKK